MSQSNHDAAYKYTVKTADQYISIPAYREGLLYAKSAFEMARSAFELRELLAVVKVALNDIDPDIVRKFRNRVLTPNKSINKQADGFRALKKDIKSKLEAIQAEGSPDIESLKWQASYALRRSAGGKPETSDTVQNRVSQRLDKLSVDAVRSSGCSCMIA